MSKRLYEESDVKAVADAIRAKNGSTDTYKLSEMAAAISKIATGGETGGDTSAEDALIDRTISGDYTNNSVTSIGRYAFFWCNDLKSLSFPEVQELGIYAINSCRSLTTVFLPKVTYMGSYCLQNNPKLKTVVITQTDSVCTLSATSAFDGCYHFWGSLEPENNPNGLQDGYIYVPDALVDSYKTADAWKVLADQIKPLSELDESILNGV